MQQDRGGLDIRPPPGLVLGEVLGSGRVGTTYAVERDGRALALKVLRPGLGRSHEARFLAAAELGRTLGHPGIVPIFEHGRLDDGRPYWLAARVDGVRLRRVVADEGGLLWRPARSILTQWLAVLRSTHEHGVIHGGIEPARVWLVGDEDDREHARVQLTGFGLLGSPRDPWPIPASYEAPELGHAEPDAATDVYALGASMYETLTGMPWAGGEGASPGVCELVPDVPRAIDRVLARALAVERTRRYDDVAELLEAFCEAAGVAVPPSVSLEPIAALEPIAPAPAPAPAPVPVSAPPTATPSPSIPTPRAPSPSSPRAPSFVPPSPMAAPKTPPWVPSASRDPAVPADPRGAVGARFDALRARTARGGARRVEVDALEDEDVTAVRSGHESLGGASTGEDRGRRATPASRPTAPASTPPSFAPPPAAAASRPSGLRQPAAPPPSSVATPPPEESTVLLDAAALREARGERAEETVMLAADALHPGAVSMPAPLPADPSGPIMTTVLDLDDAPAGFAPRGAPREETSVLDPSTLTPSSDGWSTIVLPGGGHPGGPTEHTAILSTELVERQSTAALGVDSMIMIGGVPEPVVPATTENLPGMGQPQLEPRDMLPHAEGRPRTTVPYASMRPPPGPAGWLGAMPPAMPPAGPLPSGGTPHPPMGFAPPPMVSPRGAATGPHPSSRRAPARGAGVAWGVLAGVLVAVVLVAGAVALALYLLG